MDLTGYRIKDTYSNKMVKMSTSDELKEWLLTVEWNTGLVEGFIQDLESGRPTTGSEVALFISIQKPKRKG